LCYIFPCGHALPPAIIEIGGLNTVACTSLSFYYADASVNHASRCAGGVSCGDDCPGPTDAERPSNRDALGVVILLVPLVSSCASLRWCMLGGSDAADLSVLPSITLASRLLSGRASRLSAGSHGAALAAVLPLGSRGLRCQLFPAC